MKQCYAEFYNATLPVSLAVDVCAVCATEADRLKDGVHDLSLHDLPNAERLRPIDNHDALHLFDGLLLEPAVEERGQEIVVTICGTEVQLSQGLGEIKYSSSALFSGHRTQEGNKQLLRHCHAR